MKSIIKEIIIILLLCIAICLILGVIFYNYIPTNKVVPSKVEAYSTSDSIKEEINEEIVEYPKQNIVFEITDSDLTLYRKSDSYDAGKANPFAASTTNSVGTDITGNSETTITKSVESGNSQSSTEEFFKDTTLK